MSKKKLKKEIKLLKKVVNRLLDDSNSMSFVINKVCDKKETDLESDIPNIQTNDLEIVPPKGTHL